MNINYRRVSLGGLIAGVIIVLSAITMVPVVGNEMSLALQKFNLPPLSIISMLYFIVVSLLMGFVLIYLYAVAIPRMKEGITTSIKISLIVWLIGYMLPNFANVVYGFMPIKLTIIGTVWGLFELVIAAIVGSRFYKEKASNQ
jgi:hypothetical protein